MAAPQYKQSYKQNLYNDYYTNQNKYISNIRPAKIKRKKIEKKRSNLFAVVLQLLFAALFVFYVEPFYTDNITRPIVLRAQKYPEIKTDLTRIAFPTTDYLHNNHLLGVSFLSSVETKNPQMQALYETYHMTNLENALKSLTAAYPSFRGRHGLDLL